MGRLRSFFRFLGRAAVALALLLAIGVVYALWAHQDIPAAELESRYARPESKFIEIDGVRLHYIDEGRGPVVLLLHANFSNLLDWDPWAAALQDSHRVIRFDMTSHGLTGPDPTGDYTLARTLRLMEGFVDALQLDDMTVAGTSLGGTLALHYATTHPDRVQRLILLSPGSLEGKERRARGGVPRVGYVLKYILPRALPKFMLSSGFGDPAALPDSLVDRWYELWRREGQREAQLDRLSQYQSGDIESLIRAVRVPVLLLWGELNTTAKFSQAATFRELLRDSPSLTFIPYPGLGHMALQEDGARMARDVRDWLAAPPLPGYTTRQIPPAVTWPAPDSDRFCVVMQQRMTGTELTPANTLFMDMPAYRSSKPDIRPLRTYQIVTYQGATPIRVSCKMKTAAHLRSEYGAETATTQQSCAAMARSLQADAVSRLRAANLHDAAKRAAELIIDDTEAYATGRAYLASYPLSERDAAGRIHLSVPGLFQDYDSWFTPLLPRIVQGQSYCHVPTSEYLSALARGEQQPGMIVTTDSDASVAPPTPQPTAAPAT
jgi:pimeloyl-ACP methyl ester carboxylesterase